MSTSPTPDAAVEGPSYPPALKLLTGLLALALGLWGWRALDGLDRATVGSGAHLLFVAGLLVVLVGFWEVATSRTTIDGEAIVQRSLWSRRVPLRNITQLKLLRVPGLDWLVVPRLVVRTRGLGLATFRAGDVRLVAAFRRLVYGDAG